MSTHDINGRPTDPDTHTRRVVQTEWGPMPVTSQAIEFGSLPSAPKVVWADSGCDDPPLVLRIEAPHVATLPDGRTVDLPTGTVLREGMTWEGRPADPLRDLCDAFKANQDPAVAAMISKLREQVDRAASPLLERARDLLQRAVGPLFETGSEDVRAAIVAFLAGEVTPDRTDERARDLLRAARSHVKRARDQHPGDFRDARGEEIAAWAEIDELLDAIDAFLAGMPAPTAPEGLP